MPQPKLRASTVGRIRDAGEGFDVLPTPNEHNPVHATLKLPESLTDEVWEKLDEVFDEPVDNAASLERGE